MHCSHCDKSMKFGRHRHFAMLEKMRVGHHSPNCLHLTGFSEKDIDMKCYRQFEVLSKIRVWKILECVPSSTRANNLSIEPNRMFTSAR